MKKEPLILIVDDLPKNIQMLGTVLRQEGFDLAIANQGERAVALAEKLLPHLILLDVAMPTMDGFEACRRLKASERTRHIPIIFLTARTESEDIVKGFEVGAADYVTKPFNVPELLARVRTQLQIKEQQDVIGRKSQEYEELLHVLCHDLSIPLGNVISVSDILKEDPMAPVGELMQVLRNSATNGLDIIQLVRRMRQLDQKGLTLGPVRLIDAVRQSATMLESTLRAKEIELKVEVSGKLMVIAESTSLVNSILNNLLTNAAKFSHQGGAIEIEALERGDRVALAVRDRGVGMPANLVDDLFDVSKATSRVGTNGEQGTGFGMPLVAKFVHAYGARVDVCSRMQVGAVPITGPRY